MPDVLGERYLASERRPKGRRRVGQGVKSEGSQPKAFVSTDLTDFRTHASCFAPVRWTGRPEGDALSELRRNIVGAQEFNTRRPTEVVYVYINPTTMLNWNCFAVLHADDVVLNYVQMARRPQIDVRCAARSIMSPVRHLDLSKLHCQVVTTGGP